MARSLQALTFRTYSTGELFLISLGVIATNFLVAVYCPTTHILEDEIAFYDTIWRNVLGYRLGIDYHNPLGFGPFEFSALLWKIIGPHDFILKLANTLLIVPVALIACIIIKRYDSIPAPFAIVLCIATAFELSSPNSFGFGIVPTSLGLSGFYNRISIACLSVMFLHAFADVNGPKEQSGRLDLADISISAVLILLLFLFKISAFFIGLMILAAGIISYRNKLRGLANALIAVALASILILATAAASRIGISQMIGEYITAGKAKGVPGVTQIYGTLFKDPYLLLNAALAIFALYVLRMMQFRNILPVMAVFIVCGAATFLLNIANEYETIWMFPPAIAIMAATVRPNGQAIPQAAGEGGMPGTSGGSQILAMPAIAFFLILAGQAVGTFTGLLSDLAVAAGVRNEYVVSGGKQIHFRTFCDGEGCDYEESITDGLGLIKSLGLTHEVIATLTHSNPFPVLLQSRPHKGTEVWWNFGFNVPKDAELEWRDVLGDATVVMVPLEGDYPHVREKLLKTVQPRLDRDFDLLRKDKYWKVYRLKRNASS